MIPRIAIIGGGPGGLATAYELQRMADRPISVTLYEASERLGGKVFTPQFTSTGPRYEAGAAEFYNYEHFGHDPLRELIEEFGLPVRTMSGPAVVIDGQVIANIDDVRDHLGHQASAALLEFDRVARDHMTPREFYASGDTDTHAPPPATVRFDAMLTDITCPRAKHFVEHMIHSDLAAEPPQTSVEYGLQNYLMNDPSYMTLYGIEGGNQRLVDEMTARIDATLRLEHRVERVVKGHNDTMLVRARKGDEVSEQEFDAVVIALPHDQVNRVEYGGNRLAAAIAAHHAHYNHPAHYLRVTMLFDRAFWRDHVTDSYWMVDRFGGCCLYDESSRDPASTCGVLGWLIGGDAARAMSAMTDDDLVEQVLSAFPAFLQHGGELLREVRVHRWTASVNALPGGLTPIPLDARHVPEPFDHPQLFMVGDYLYDSTLNGVIDSAEYVAAWIAGIISSRDIPAHEA